MEREPCFCQLHSAPTIYPMIFALRGREFEPIFYRTDLITILDDPHPSKPAVLQFQIFEKRGLCDHTRGGIAAVWRRVDQAGNERRSAFSINEGWSTFSISFLIISFIGL